MLPAPRIRALNLGGRLPSRPPFFSEICSFRWHLLLVAGDPARDVGSLTGSLHPRHDAEDPQGALGRLRLVRSRLPGSRGQAPEWRSERGISARQLPAPSTVRPDLSPFREARARQVFRLDRSIPPVGGRGAPCQATSEKSGPVRPAGSRGGRCGMSTGGPGWRTGLSTGRREHVRSRGPAAVPGRLEKDRPGADPWPCGRRPDPSSCQRVPAAPSRE